AIAFVLNYLSFVGPAIAIALFLAAGLIGAPSFVAAAWPPAAYLLVHLTESNAVTPTVVGHRLTLSPFLVFLSFVFWLLLGAPLGAVLPPPLLIIGTVAKETYDEVREAASETEA